MIDDKALIAKADAGEGLTVEEIKRYQQLVKPQHHVYGKYGTLALKYLEERQLNNPQEGLNNLTNRNPKAMVMLCPGPAEITRRIL